MLIAKVVIICKPNSEFQCLLSVLCQWEFLCLPEGGKLHRMLVWGTTWAPRQWDEELRDMQTVY